MLLQSETKVFVALALGLLLLSGPACLSQTVTTIEVNDPRPLAMAAQQLQSRIAMPINYEDVPYAYSGDVVDVADEVMSPASRAANPGKHVWVPRGGALSATLPVSASGAVDPGQVTPMLGTLVSAQASQGYPGVFSATSSNGVFFVKPSSVRNQSGALAAVQPILDTLITFPSQKRSAADTLNLVVQQISGVSGTKVVLGAVPLNGMMTPQLQMSASGETARSLIVQILTAMGSRQIAGFPVPAFSYQLFFDPTFGMYALNIQRVPNMVPSPKPQPASSPARAANPLEKRQAPPAPGR